MIEGGGALEPAVINTSIPPELICAHMCMALVKVILLCDSSASGSIASLASLALRV